MKKILFFSFFIFLSFLSTRAFCDELEMQDPCFTGIFSAGYVFKHHDSLFKEVYGHGMANAITIDSCYYPCRLWGVGAKVSYWLANGRTTFLKQHTFLQEVPFTLYVRRVFNFSCGAQSYVSLGGGFVWIKEKSCYLGHAQKYKGIGEAEIGVLYPVWRCFDVTGAFRYLFPRQSQEFVKGDVGGFDLRAGIGFSF